MLDLLPPLPLLLAFLTASFILAITPGPGVLYIVTRTLAQGRAAGLASVAGVALGNMGNAAGAALGLAALFAISSLAFTIVKYAGAAYLLWLGYKTLTSMTPAASSTQPLTRVAHRRLFRDGFVVALLNPKTAIFFAAFLPQFMHAGASPIAQSLLLGSLFVLIAAATDSFYALLAAKLAPALLRGGQGFKRLGRYAVGGSFIGLGLLAALTKQQVR